MESQFIRQTILIFGALLWLNPLNADELYFSGSGTSPVTYNVTEGATVQFSCKSNNKEPVRMFLDEAVDMEIVNNWTLLLSAGNYGYHITSDEGSIIHTLTIKNVNRSETGSYTCLQIEPLDLKSLILQVVYPPSKPICEADFDSLIFFTDEELFNSFKGKCSIKDGYPPAKISFTGISEQYLKETYLNRSKNQLEGALSFPPNVTLNNSVVYCVVQQEYPSHLHLQTYKSSCSFEPFQFLTYFAVWITPSNLTILHPEDVHLICSSNVKNLVDVKWTISTLPTGISYTNTSNILTLHIEGDKILNKTMPVVVTCRITHKNRSSEDKIFINIDIKAGMGWVYMLIILPLFSLGAVILVVIIKECNFKSKCCKNTRYEQEGESQKTLPYLHFRFKENVNISENRKDEFDNQNRGKWIDESENRRGQQCHQVKTLEVEKLCNSEDYEDVRNSTGNLNNNEIYHEVVF